MLKGSFFTTESSPDAVVVDETFAAFYPDNNPVGYTFERGKIIGVMENIRVNRATENAGEKIPACYTRLQPEQRQHLFIKFQQGKKQAVLKHINSSFHEFVPENLSMSINTFQEDIDDIFTDENMMMQLSAFFLVVSLIISLLSIYSAITMNTERRRKEVAIRKINGASVGNIILLFSKTYLFVWTIVCTALFPVIYYAGNQWLMTFNRRISLNTVFFGGIYLIVLALIIFTILFKIMKVANENPAEIIKTE
jgi:ABC-type antimicrobial peptide transport system permease subunit